MLLTLITCMFITICELIISRFTGHDDDGEEEYPAWPTTGESGGAVGTPTSSAAEEEKKMAEKQGREVVAVEIVGSRLPDCSHACGSCRPCRLVIVSSACASLAQAAETCPVSYRCMCNHKCYPVP